MTKITSGHTLVSKGTLNAPHYLAVEAGGAFKAANGATSNYEIVIQGSTITGAPGGYGGVLVNATVTNGASATPWCSAAVDTDPTWMVRAAH